MKNTIKMYTRNSNKSLKYLYIDLIGESKNMDINKLCEFIDTFNNTETTFVFDYNCLDYENIKDVIDHLVLGFKNFILKAEKFTQIEKIESLECIIDEFRVKIDPVTGVEKMEQKITSNTKMFNYILDLNKNNILKFGVDLYINKNNIYYLREVLKLLSNNGISSNILFNEYPANSHYIVQKSNFDVINNNYEIKMILDNIICDNNLNIYNKKYVMTMLDTYMNNYCWKKYYPIQATLSSDFKLKICNKIDVCIDLDPLECFENGELNDEIFKQIKDRCSEYCLGCCCEDFIQEIYGE